MSEVIIREFAESDIEPALEIFFEVIKGGDTYDFAPDTSRDTAINYFTSNDTKRFVAEINGEVTGWYSLKPNRPGLASHIGNCSYMVSSKFRSNGIGKLLCEHSIAQAKKDSFKAIQFNFVVSTNTAAVNLWKKLGFEIIGTIPHGYNHSHLGPVDAYIMFRKL
jgi:ribosomal protein S18 acetylase RimI-like enzyme